MKHTNRLIEETSPYLLQHAHNPVNWYPWGDEALQKAVAENKPILVSIGYSACHWCHVMERESFEDETTAAMMNENFINIKIDREERPDLDHIYMDAVQAMTGSGGWPLNIFLTPDGKPFYGGTYFPPQKAFNRPSWMDTLAGVAQAFKERRHEIDAQAENLTQHILQSNSFGLQKVEADEIFSNEQTTLAFENLMKTADTEWGGFGKAPKFPQTFSIQYILRYSFEKEKLKLSGSEVPPSGVTEQGEGYERSSRGAALLSLDKMIQGGIYDQVGGGFARYSTDTEWLAPHFEKMLYDNALFIMVLSEAYQLTKKERYKEVIDETMVFIQRELLHPKKAFYAALDADSEGVEGKFYVWSKEEVGRVLGENATIFCAYYDVTEDGNWEHTNILRVKKPLEIFGEENKIAVDELKMILQKGKEKLLLERSKRIRPQLDDKIILGWNALMNIACSKAFAATGNQAYRQLAIDNMQFLLQAFAGDDASSFHHTWKNNNAKYPAFLDDYAYMIQALLLLQEITTDSNWLTKAKDITEYVMEHFKEEETHFFYYTAASQKDVIVRKKEVYDGAVPSGNSVMAYNLWHLGILTSNEKWKQQSLDMVASLGKAITRYPGSFGNWACLLLEMVNGTNELVLLGKDITNVHTELLAEYIPHRVLMASSNESIQWPLLANKPITNTSTIYLCSNYTCKKPVFSAKELILLINSGENE